MTGSPENNIADFAPGVCLDTAAFTSWLADDPNRDNYVPASTPLRCVHGFGGVACGKVLQRAASQENVRAVESLDNLGCQQSILETGEATARLVQLLRGEDSEA